VTLVPPSPSQASQVNTKHLLEEKTIQKEAAAPQGRTPYHQAAESMEGDCWAIEPIWLCDKHYPLWIEIRNLDDVLWRLEQDGEGETEAYQLALARLVSTVKKARALYEREHNQAGAVRQ
jgi:hypothetical protein